MRSSLLFHLCHLDFLHILAQSQQDPVRLLRDLKEPRRRPLLDLFRDAAIAGRRNGVGLVLHGRARLDGWIGHGGQVNKEDICFVDLCRIDKIVLIEKGRPGVVELGISYIIDVKGKHFQSWRAIDLSIS